MATNATEWLYKPIYDPSTQSWRYPGFASWWDNPAAVRAVEPIRSDPAAAPTPYDPNSAGAALRGVFPSRSDSLDGRGGDNGVPASDQQIGPGGMAPTASNLWDSFVGGWGGQVAPQLASYAFGALSPVPGVGNMIGRAMMGGPAPQFDFGEVGQRAQKSAEEALANLHSVPPGGTSSLAATLAQGSRDLADMTPEAKQALERDRDQAIEANPGLFGLSPVTANQRASAAGESDFASEVGGKTATSDLGEGYDAAGNYTGSMDKSGADAGEGAPAGDSKPDGSGLGSGYDSGGNYGGDMSKGGADNYGGTPSDSSSADPGYGYARGGRVTARRRFMPGDPPGPDNMIAALQTGEHVLPRDTVQGVRAGNKGSAVAALQSIRSGKPPAKPAGAPAKRPAGSAMDALRGAGAKKR